MRGDEHLFPLPGELLTSWYARRSRCLQEKAVPRLEPTRDRLGRWRHPDIRPSNACLRRAAHYFDVPLDQLKACAIATRGKRPPDDFLAWTHPPLASAPGNLVAMPALQISWCNRCLAEDFAEGRPAHIRHQWVFAYMTFCHRHRWPLVDRCGACSSYSWKFAAPARGPLRMICRDCWRPLEQSRGLLFEAEREAHASWRYLISFEAQIQTAVQGRTPDQTLLNDTSARQLLETVRDLCRLLLRNRPGYLPQSIPLNMLICPDMAAGEWTPVYRANYADTPLAVVGLMQRRYLLAAVCAVIDPRPEVGAAFFGEEQPPATERFIELIDRDVLEHHMESADWPPDLARRIRRTRSACSRRRILERLRRRLSSLERGIASLQN